MEIKDGEIYIGGVSVDEIANSFGTPTYVYDEARFAPTTAKSGRLSKNIIRISKCSTRSSAATIPQS